MASPYRRTQTSPWLVAAYAVLAEIAFVIALFQPWPGIAWLLAAALLLVMAACVFSSLTVEVGDCELVWYFGPGLWKYRVSLSDIKTARPVRNRWWYGWGIRRLPGCWIYNVAGLSAVEITKTDDRRIRIGTDRPESLADAIKHAA